MRFIIFLIVLLGACPVFAEETHRLEWQGIERLYRVHNAQQAPAPTMVVLHGHKNTDDAIAAREKISELAWDRLDELAVREGFVTVNPAARLGQCNLMPGLGERVQHPDGGELDDVGFIFAVARRLIDEAIADPERLYLEGFSDGAIIAYRLLCSAGNPFIAAVAFVGTMHEGLLDTCADIPPTPIMVVAGTKDRILPYDGWIFRTGREISVPETMDFWRLRHGCKRQRWKFFDDVVEEDKSRVVRVWWTECDRDFTVELLRVEGGGHSSPNPEPISEASLKRGGGHNQDIDSAVVTWRFMQRFPEPADPDP